VAVFPSGPRSGPERSGTEGNAVQERKIHMRKQIELEVTREGMRVLPYTKDAKGKKKPLPKEYLLRMTKNRGLELV
jgi:hypothetical protein